MSSETIPTEQETAKSILENDLVTRLQKAQSEKDKLQRDFDALNERFKYVLKATQDAIWDWDLVTNSGWYGEGLFSLFGYDPKQTHDGVKFWYDTIHPADKERVINGIHAVIDHGGKHWQDQYRFRRSDGSYAWVFDRGYALHDEVGKPVRMVGSMQDVTTEVEAQEALRESEEKFRATFDNIAVGISIATPDGKFLLVNKAYPKIFGFSHEEFSHKKITDLSHPDELEVDRKLISALLSGQSQPIAREKRYLHKSGRIIWGRVFGTVINDAYGAAKYIVGVLEDITEQRDALQSLRENEERLRLVIESARIGTWDFNPQTGKLHWDTRCKAMFGMHPDDYADYDIFLKCVHPDDRQAADEANRKALSGVGDGEYDLEYRTVGLRDGIVRSVRAKGMSYKDDNGVPVRYTGTVIDITREKEQEQRLREEEERFRLLATSIPQIVWTTDAEGMVDYMSEKWLMYTGHTPGDNRFSFRDLMHPDDLDRVIPEWNESMKKGTTFNGEYRLKNIVTNEYRWFSCTTTPHKNHHSEVIKWIGSATDIHDQKMVEIRLENKVAERTRELTALNGQLEKSNAELEQYAYVTSHDLKEPLRKIQTYNNLITSKYPSELTPGMHDYLKKIESASNRMAGLIEDLLKYSQLSNPVALFEEVDLNYVVGNIQLEFEHALSQKRISVNYNNLPRLQAVPFQMHQLFSNLFSNAIKFSKPAVPNVISISCSFLSPEERAVLAPLSDGRHYKIIFEDQGIGFSPEYKEQIFTIFQRLFNRKDFEGHGIGLALCRKIVSNHRGLIWATSEEGKGARFTLVLPAEQVN